MLENSNDSVHAHRFGREDTPSMLAIPFFKSETFP